MAGHHAHAGRVQRACLDQAGPAIRSGPGTGGVRHPRANGEPHLRRGHPARTGPPLEATLAAEVDPERYVSDDRGLDMAGLLEAFQGYFREHAESWVERFGDKDVGAQLVLDAYLQLVANCGGRIAREYAVGRGRTDFVIEWRSGGGPGPSRRGKHVIECKVLREKSGHVTDPGPAERAVGGRDCGASLHCRLDSGCPWPRECCDGPSLRGSV